MNATAPQLIEHVTNADGAPGLQYHWHEGQRAAWESTKRIVLVTAGWQSGKSQIGPPWLLREIQRCGPGDYLVASPTYPLMLKKVLPDFLRLFKTEFQFGEFVGGPKNCFTFTAASLRRFFKGTAHERERHTDEVRVFFGHASDPDSLESATMKAAWLDEAGQKTFRLPSWEVVLARLSIAEGRVLITSRPYDLGWMKQTLYDPWKAAGGNHPLIDVIRFDSTKNPAFPKAEFERARTSMPTWKFRMRYQGYFERPAGVIYDCFDEARHMVPRFTLPDRWQRYLGLDFGGVNTAGVFLAEEPITKRLYAYREYRAGSRTAREHVESMKHSEPMVPICVGGSHSEGQWRAEFQAAGLPVQEPAVKEVEVGIDRVYGTIKRGEVYVFDHLSGLLDELGSYSRVLDDAGEPTEAIEAKETYHLLDALRYVIGWARRSAAPFQLGTSKTKNAAARAPSGIIDSHLERSY